MDIWAVSVSRISPTRITSGSSLIEALRPVAKVNPEAGLTCIWLMLLKRYSTGSSIVKILRPTASSWLTVAYWVVVLPEPVGPLINIMPKGLFTIFMYLSKESGRKPISGNGRKAKDLSRIRITTISPYTVLVVATRRSTSLSPISNVICPS